MKLKFNGFLTLLLVLITQITFAQDIAVTGTVTDQSGLPIPGANVLVKGTSNGTQTDFDGNFKITAAPGSTLVFSFLGMKTIQLPASASMKVKMTDDSVQLEGVVVTAFGIKKQKRELGYATANVSAKDLTEVSNTNVFESLSGKIAGADITSPAQVGASTKVIIRGFNSLSGSSPLYIVDGSPITNGTSSATNNTRSFDAGTGISDLDPNNIESMTVLKGAAASALYGSRAANGVIIITTKSGKNKSKISVELMHSTDFSQVARVPHLQNQFGQGWDHKSWSNWAGHPENTSSNENGSWGPAFNGEVRTWGTIIDNAQQIKPYVGLPNNVKDFFETGTTFTNSARVSGGGENSNFSINFTDVTSDGIIPTAADAYSRKTFGFNGGITSDKLSFKANINYVKKDQYAVNTGQGNDSGEGNTFTQEMLQIPRDISVVDLQDYNNNPYNTPGNYFTPYASNPYWVVNENSTRIQGNRFFGNANIVYNFNKKFSLSYQAGGDYRVEKVKSYGAIVSYEPGTPQLLGGANPVVGGVTETTNEATEFDTNLILTYNTAIGEDFNVNALAGFNSNQRANSTLQGSITDLDIPNYYELTNSSVKPSVLQQDIFQKSFGVYASLEASYKERLYLTLTGRNDWTSTLPQGANSYFYPSASLAGIVLDTNDYFLKLRGGYAQVARDTGPYQTESALRTGFAALQNEVIGSAAILLPIGGVNGYESAITLGNGNLKPERTNEVEVGFEANLFSKRVNLDASLYDRKTNDLLFRRPLAPSTGYLFQTGNILDVDNKGVELVLNVIPVKTTNIQWDFTTTFSKNDSEVTDIKGGVEKIQLATDYAISFNAVEGQPLGVFSAFVPKMTPAGQYIVDPATGYYKVTDDEQIVGTSQRDFVMGFKNRVSYKNLALTFGIDWKQGGEMYSYTKRLSHFTGNGIETTYNDRNSFIIPNSVIEVTDGDGNVTGYAENTTAINSISQGDSNGNTTDFWNTSNNPGVEQGHVIDKTFVRLRDIALTYSFPSETIKRMGLTNVTFSIYGKNLAMWTPDENPYIDPELSTFGSGILSEQGEFGANPSQRSFGASLKLTF
jgi:TonB-linked SusC/RagA family outer membrane protein